MRTVVLCCVLAPIVGATPPPAWQSSQASELLAGVATADITPEPGLRLWGYSGRSQGAKGTLDPLLAKALVLKSGDEAAAIVTLDLGRTPEDALLARIAERTAASCGIKNLLITASHTHQAPSLESYSDEPNPYGVTVVETIERLVSEAASQLAPVRLGVGRIDVDFAHNRRRLLPDGRIAMQWRNAEREPTEPVDRQCTAIRLDRGDGTPLAVLMHYACHPVVLGPDNLEYSADFVGAACRTVANSLGTTCLYLQGACGDINPYDDKTPLAEGGVAAMQSMGRQLGSLVAQAAGRLTTQPSAEANTLQFVEQRIPVRVRWDVADPEVASVLKRVYGARFESYLAKALQSGQVELALTTLVIDDRLALVGMPGEVFVQFQLQLKRESTIPHTLLVGYTNGYHGYFPTIRDAALGSYGGKVATYVDVGSGERLTSEALITLYRLSGKLTERPRLEDFRLIEWDQVKPHE